MSKIQPEDIVIFYPYTIAIPQHVNANFEKLRLGHNDQEDKIDTKQNIITGGATSITSDNLTPNLVLVSNNDGKVSVLDNITSANIYSLLNISGNIQNQLDDKAYISGNASQVFHVANATLGTHAINKSQLDNALSNSTPAGTIIWYSKNIVPTGYLKCNGSAISRTTYANLFSIIGTTFGAGDGSTTFNIPDLRGEFIRGWDDGRGVDSGRTFGSYQADGVKQHTHKYQDIYFAEHYGWTIPGATTTPLPLNRGSNGGVDSDNHGFQIERTTNINENSTPDNRPRNRALLPCIKY